MTRILSNKLLQPPPDVNIKKTSLSLQRRTNFFGGIPKAAKTTTGSSNNNSKDKKIPNVSANCWAVFDVKKASIMRGRREHQKREIASLTKVMTCWVVINVCREYGLNPKSTMVTVSDVAAGI